MLVAGNRRQTSHRSRREVGAIFFVSCLLAVPGLALADDKLAAEHFHKSVEPILEKYCYTCHGYGERKGDRALDEFKTDAELVGNKAVWLAVLKNVRTGVMPPQGEDRPSAEEQKLLRDWIEFEAFGIDSKDPDPGRVTLRRLNRVEYRNTIRDLMGIDFDTTDEFPPDDAGFGFDNVGDALSLSPLLMEKYFNAAEAIVAEAVPSKEVNARLVKQYEQYRRFFPQGPAPAEADKRDTYARDLLKTFVHKAYRRPVDDDTVNRLLALAKAGYTAPGQTFEASIGRAVVAILSSPRFLFRVESIAPGSGSERFSLIDEYSLASRLSYFFWSTMPDAEAVRLAERGELRANLPAEIDRMMKDPKSRALSENFAGQWLRARDIQNMEIEPLGALGLAQELDRLREELGKAKKELRATAKAESKDQKAPQGKKDKSKAPVDRHRSSDYRAISAEYRRVVDLAGMFNADLRRAMYDETIDYFDYVARENRDVTEFIDSNYAFVNQTLARHYGIEGVKGDTIRRVELSAGSPRGGILTQGTVLAVTSNPTRTSPVKRGLFILNNVLGYPAPPPPPPNIPVLEVAQDSIRDHKPTIRESQELHRRDPLCHSCHARMDPLGLALENFNAMGMWRDSEHDSPIDASGELVTGEKFTGIRELKTIIKDKHRVDFYRCLTEKLLTYALGRGLEYYDEHTVDLIVDKLDRGQGRFSTLLVGIVESAPFQRMRRANTVADAR